VLAAESLAAAPQRLLERAAACTANLTSTPYTGMLLLLLPLVAVVVVVALRLLRKAEFFSKVCPPRLMQCMLRLIAWQCWCKCSTYVDCSSSSNSSTRSHRQL
jgi:hypothetical protein